MAGTLQAGCVERLLQIRTDPPGAEVTVNGEPMVVVVDGKTRRAVTPVEVPFDFYGTFQVGLRREGYLSESIQVPVSAPFYQYPPIDFFAENLIPWTIRDHRPVEVTLRPLPELDDREAEDLLRRMAELRSEVSNEEREE